MKEIEQSLREGLADAAVVLPDPHAFRHIQQRARRMQAARRVTGAVVVALLVVVGFALVAGLPRTTGRPAAPIPSISATPTSSATPLPDRGPQIAAALAFYRAVAAHDKQAAERLIDPALTTVPGSGTSILDYMLSNYVSLTDITVVRAQPALTGPGLTEVLVSYRVVLKQPSANDVSGPGNRFVLVGRVDAHSPWLVQDITTSP